MPVTIEKETSREEAGAENEIYEKESGYDKEEGDNGEKTIGQGQEENSRNEKETGYSQAAIGKNKEKSETGAGQKEGNIGPGFLF